MFKKLNRLIELFAKFVTMYYKLSTEAVCFYDQNFCGNYEQNTLKKSTLQAGIEFKKNLRVRFGKYGGLKLKYFWVVKSKKVKSFIRG